MVVPSGPGSIAVDGGENARGADRRMSGKGKLDAGREDADAPPIGAAALEKSGFGQVELRRDSLHRFGRDGGCIGKDSERIPAEPPVGEDIREDVFVRHRVPVLRDSARRKGLS
jgi:hypothetical protein